MAKKISFDYLIFFIFISQFLLIKSQGENPIPEPNVDTDSDSGSGSGTSENQVRSTILDIKTIYNNNIRSNLISINNDGGFSTIYDNYYYQCSTVDKQEGLLNGDIRLPQLKLSNTCLNHLKDKYHNQTIIISKIFRKKQLQKNTEAGITDLTDIMYYEFFSVNEESVTTIDIKTECTDPVYYYLPIYSSDNTLKNKFISVSGQNPDDELEKLRNYDIFDPDSKIYKDICATITFSVASENIIDQDSFENYDITLNGRRNYYFPGNTALCPQNFEYLGVDKNTFSSICKTSLTLYSNSEPYTLHDNYFSFGEQDIEKFKSKNKDIYFSMGVLKCIKLPFTKKGFKENYGSYFMLIIMFIILASYLILILTGKYHLLSVLELLYNSNIKSMNYIKNANAQINNSNNQVIPYDIKSNNLGTSHQTMISNGQLLSNALVGNNYIYNPNNDQVSISKKSNNTNNLKKKENKKEKGKENIMSNVDEQENDFESEKGNDEKDKTNIYNDSNNNVNVLNVKNKNKDKKKNTEQKNDKISKKEEEDEEEEDEDEDDDGNEEDESNRSYNNHNKDKKANKKSNPPKKKNGNGGDEDEDYEEGENGKKDKKRKSKNPIEISLNVKDLRDMMFKDQMPKSENTKLSQKEKAKSKSKQKKNNNNNNNYKNGNGNNNYNNNFPQNGYPFPPFFPPMGMMPYGMPPYPFQNNGANPQNFDETHNLKRELEYQKELNERRDREMRREREDMQERERERQRQRDYDLDRERRLRDMERMYGNQGMELGMERFEQIYKKNKGVKRGSALWNDDSQDILMKEREKFSQEQDKFNKIKEKLEAEIEKKNEENEKIQKDLNLIKEEQKVKQVEYEKQLLKTNQDLKEQFEKEKKEIIDAKNREIQILREDKDREIQRLKEDKDREIDLIKQDMQKEIKKKDEKIKKKEKVIEKQKNETKELKKDLTTNGTFYTNNIQSTLRQNNLDFNSGFIKREEKIESPQVVVSINSIFTDQELNAMDFEESCQFDKRNLCQVYLSFINRKQPLFFFFNYNSSSSGISVFQINYQSIRFIIICIDFMIYMFLYCTFFGTKSISYIYLRKYNFRRMCILGIIISPFCLIFRSIIHHFVYDPMNKKIAEIKMRCYTNFSVGKKKEELKVNEFKEFWDSDGNEEKNKEVMEKKEELDDIQEIENDENLPEEEKIRRKEKYEKRRLKLLIKEVIALFQKKILISFCIMIFVMLFEWIYISTFCAVYKNSQLKFFVSILVCYGFSNLIPFVYCLVPTILKQDAVRDEARYSFFLAKVFQII